MAANQVPQIDFTPATALTFWQANYNPNSARAQALEARWQTRLANMQLSNPWQSILLDDQLLPGVWWIRRVKRKVTAQINKASGDDGGSVSFKGLTNPQFKLNGEIHTFKQFAAWVAILPALEIVTNDPQTRGQHLIENMMCSLAGVRQVVIDELEYIAPEAGGPLGIEIGVIGANRVRGNAVTPKARPVPSKGPAPAPQINVNRNPTGASANPAPVGPDGVRELLNFVNPQIVQPPGSAR